MDFGMPMLIEIENLRDNVKLCKELGLNFIELNMNMPSCQPGKTDSGELREYVRNSSVYFTLHTADDMNASDFNPFVSEAHTATVVWAIELAVKTGIPIINMHLNTGTYVTLPDQRIYLFNKYIDMYMDRIKEFRKKCEQAARKADITICIENMEGHKAYDIRAIEYLIESDLFALTLDTGHNFCAGGIDFSIYEKYPHKLSHMHLHDAKGSSPHLALGSGAIDLHEKLKLAEQNKCRVVIETKTIASLKKSIAYLKKHSYM